MQAAKGYLLIGAAVAIVIAIAVCFYFGYNIVREMNPTYQAAQREALNRQTWENELDHRERVDQIQRDAAGRDMGAKLWVIAQPVLALIALAVVVFVLIVAFVFVMSKIVVWTLNDIMFVGVDARGMWRVSRAAAWLGATLGLAERQNEWAGRARLAQAENQAASVDWQALGNLRNLSLKGGSGAAGRALPNPHAPAQLDNLDMSPDGETATTHTPGLFTISDMTTGGKYELPFGRDPRGEEVFAPLDARANFLVGGTTQSGKTNLLKAQLKLLTTRHAPREIQFAIIDPKRRSFLDYAEGNPFTFGFASDQAGWRELLARVETERDRRQKAGGKRWAPGGPDPLLFVIVDELAGVVNDPDSYKIMVRLAATGLEGGVVINAATQYPNSQTIREDLKVNLRLRACGSVPSYRASTVVLDFSGAEDIRPDEYAFLTNLDGRGPLVRVPYAEPRTGVIDMQPGAGGVWTPAATGPVERDFRAETIQFITQGQKTLSQLYRHFGNAIEQDTLHAIIADLEASDIAETEKGPKTGGNRATYVRLKGRHDNSW